MRIIGVDVGGTKISAGLTEGGRILKLSTQATPFDRPQYEVVQAVIQTIEEVFDPETEGIGIGVPGLVDLAENTVIDVVNIPSWDSVPLSDLISEYFNKKVLVNNDANCFALGEKYYGKGKPYSNFVGVTIGTGMGAGIIINGHLYPGLLCGAGEFGNIWYRDKNIEAFASGQYLRDKGVDGKVVFKRAAIGDPVALKVFDDLGKHIGRAVANILFALAPEAIIFGGSVSKGYKYFSDSMNEFLEDNFPYRRLYNQLVIHVSDSENSGILGAASLILDSDFLISPIPK